MTQRMILTHEEMVLFQFLIELIKDTMTIKFLELLCYFSGFYFQEEVVLKRCWLARYWGLAARYGNIHERTSDD